MLPNLVHSCPNLRHQMFPIMLRTKYKFFNLAYKILHGLATISPNSSTTLSYSVIWANISPFPHSCLNIKFIVNINPMHQLFTLPGMFSQIFAQLAASYNSQLFQIPPFKERSSQTTQSKVLQLYHCLSKWSCFIYCPGYTFTPIPPPQNTL